MIRSGLRLGLSLSVPGLGPIEALSFAERLEAAEVDTIGVGEAEYDAYVWAGSIAAATRSVRVMSAVATWDHPSVLAARAAATIAELSGGRYVLGLGPGVLHDDDTVRPLARMRQYVSEVRNALGSADVPVHMAAARPGMATLAGEVADGVLLSRVHTIDWLRDVMCPAVEEGERHRGRRIERGVLVRCAVTDDKEFAMAALRLEVARSDPGLIRTIVHASGCDAVDDLRDGLVKEMCVVGSPEECRDQLRRYEGLVDWISLFPCGDPDPAKAVERVIRMVEWGPGIS